MTCDVSVPSMAVIPAGAFLMGESPNDKFTNDTERPAHRVSIEPFALGQFPVTVGEYRDFHGDDAGGAEDSDVPVVNVSWFAAQAYCAFLSEQTGKPYRLPTEAEWEYACRAGATTPYPFGDEISPAQANFLYDESGNRIGLGRLNPRDTFSPNKLGVADLCGNVCEWCEDAWHPGYVGAPSDGQAWIEGGAPDRRVIRGGAWDYLPRLLRSSWRDWLEAAQRRDNVGFRVALTLHP